MVELKEIQKRFKTILELQEGQTANTLEAAWDAMDDATKLVQELDAKLQNALRLLARTEQERSIAVRQVKYLAKGREHEAVRKSSTRDS
jgi:hypothetical protein